MIRGVAKAANVHENKESIGIDIGRRCLDVALRPIPRIPFINDP